jgi:hypothetical protein
MSTSNDVPEVHVQCSDVEVISTMDNDTETLSQPQSNLVDESPDIKF